MATKSFTVKTKLPPNPFVHEILELVSKQRTKAKKIEVLQEHRCDALTSVLIWNFDDSVLSMLPEGEVPFNKNEAPLGTDHTSLRKECKNLYHFVKGGNDKLNQSRREMMFIQLLEGLHESEAKVICLAKDKQIGKRYKITKACISEAYPEIKWGNRS